MNLFLYYIKYIDKQLINVYIFTRYFFANGGQMEIKFINNFIKHVKLSDRLMCFRENPHQNHNRKIRTRMNPL
jgi:hypothetical protein